MFICIHEVARLIDNELIVRPEGVIECEIAMLFRSICIVESRHVADHIHAQFAVEGLLTLIERTNPHAYLHAHSNYK